MLVIYFSCMIMSGCVFEKEPEAFSLQVGDTVPYFSIVMNDGSTLTSRSLEGHKSVLAFFNTDCNDCRRELPVIQKAMEDNPDIQFICIAREENEAQIREFWQRNNLTLPYSPQTDRKIYNLFATNIIPRIYLISPELKITGIYVEKLPNDIIW